MNHWEPSDLNKQPERPNREWSSKDFQFRGMYEKLMDPKTPYIFEDETQLNGMTDEDYYRKKDLVERIKFNDERRDYSEEKLTDEER
jgi:hypothetical protein